MKITLDKKMLQDFETRQVKKIKLFFFWGGCSGTKLDIAEEFEIDASLFLAEGCNYSFDVYVEMKDKEKFEGAIITKLEKIDPKNPHLVGWKISYIFTNEKVKARCGCGTSFSFENKKVQWDIEKLKKLKGSF